MTSQPHPTQPGQGGIQGRSCSFLPWKSARATDSTLYSFAVDGKQLPLFATISRIHRDDDSEIQGYQRPAVLTHIKCDPQVHRVRFADDPERPRRGF